MNRRRGFTLTELLVSVSIILLLAGLISSAVSAARASAKVSATRATIEKLNQIIAQHYSTYASRAVAGGTTSALRASGIRRTISAELPDSWDDVQRVASGTVPVVPSVPAAGMFPNSSVQRAYAAMWNALPPATTAATLGSLNEDAECLFMIVMRGGIADCLDCGGLRTSEVGDTDGDGMPEFLDAWGNPIRYVLWPAGLQLPASGGVNFFSTDIPFLAAPSGRVMRPLIFSGGPDRTNSINVNGGANLDLGLNCGDPTNATLATFGGLNGSPDGRGDNITNLDAEARQ